MEVRYALDLISLPFSSGRARDDEPLIAKRGAPIPAARYEAPEASGEALIIAAAPICW